MKITYSVPAETTSVFVVLTDRAPAELSSIVPWRMGRWHGRAGMEVLGTPRLELEAFPAGRSPWRRIEWSDEALLGRARHHVIVSSTAPVCAQPKMAQLARAAARGVAQACHGVVADPLTGIALFPCPRCPGESRDFRLSDDWLGWTTAEEKVPCPRCEPDGARPCACPGVTTRGLRRFGLPEITLDGAACAHRLCAITVLRTVAERLVAGHLAWAAGNPGAASRTIGERLRLDGAGFAVLTGGPEADGAPIRVRLTRDAALRSCLRVGPPGAARPETSPGRYVRKEAA